MCYPWPLCFYRKDLHKCAIQNLPYLLLSSSISSFSGKIMKGCLYFLAYVFSYFFGVLGIFFEGELKSLASGMKGFIMPRFLELKYLYNQIELVI